MNSLHRSSHAHSSSYPSVFLSGATRSLARAPSRGTKSESGGSIPTSTHSTPLIQSPASSPGRPSESWKFPSPSRNPSVERISGPLLRSKSTSKGDTSHFLFDRITSPQSWNISPKNDVVQDEQTERYQRTHMRVMRAVGSTTSSLASDMTHEVLVHGTDLLKFAPIPGLEGAARVLLGIWDALQQVETNRLACLRLTERCADILIAIQEGISGLDKRVADTLHEPMERLEDAFQEIKSMMLDKLCQSPFRRYFKRDEVLGEIVPCNTKLQDCLGHFDRSINLRVLEYGLASRNSPSARTDMSFHSTEEIHERIRQIQERQNELDRSRDLVDQPPPSDQEEILEKLGIQKKDIPDAIKTLLRALESLRSTKVFDKVSASLSSRRRSSTWPISHSDENDLRLQDRESIERDIRALKSAYVSQSQHSRVGLSQNLRLISAKLSERVFSRRCIRENGARELSRSKSSRFTLLRRLSWTKSIFGRSSITQMFCSYMVLAV
ncbi:Serine/threonine-protein kinase TNNI3K [Termitomyces sp. T112]|nr:Serine/threonine-protein kinase TNNI3K [Termitomyces sp. T112]